jgi:streptogramin lyase
VALDGSGLTAVLPLRPGTLVSPVALAAGLDAHGRPHLYVADDATHVILDVPTNRPLEARELAGQHGRSGRVDGHGAQARFNRPSGLSLTSERVLIVTDRYNDAIRRVTTEDAGNVRAGSVATLFRVQAASATLAGSLNRPGAALMDGKHALLVADSHNGVLRRIELGGEAGPALRTWAGTLPAPAGLVDGLGALARFQQPTGIVLAANGDAFVADPGNRVIRKVTPEGDVTTWARGSAEVPMRGVLFLAAAPDGTLFGTDTEAGIIFRVAADGAVTRLAGSPRAAGQAADLVVDGPLAQARFHSPMGILWLDDGTLFVTDGHCLRRIHPNGGVTTVAGHATESGAVDLPQEAARFDSPAGLALGPDGHLYIADSGNHVIRRVSRDGREVSVWAGMPDQAGSVDGPHGTATLDAPTNLAFGKGGWLYVTGQPDAGLRRIHPRNGSIRTVVRAAGEDRATDHGHLLREDGSAPVKSALLHLGWGIAATRAGDLLITTAGAQDGASGGVLQVTEPVLADPDAAKPGETPGGLDGDLNQLFPDAEEMYRNEAVAQWLAELDGIRYQLHPGPPVADLDALRKQLSSEAAAPVARLGSSATGGAPAMVQVHLDVAGSGPDWVRLHLQPIAAEHKADGGTGSGLGLGGLQAGGGDRKYGH